MDVGRATEKARLTEDLIGFLLGRSRASLQQVERATKRLGMCREAQQLFALVGQVIRKEESTMVSGSDVAEIARLINEVIKKSERDRLKDKLLSFYDHYTRVLESGYEDRVSADKRQKARAKIQEIRRHVADARRAVERGDAQGASDAISRAEDDLEELEQILSDP